MQQAPYETVELVRAETGTELWAAIEAGQYARLIRAEEAESEAEARAIEAFVEELSRCIEGWETIPVEARAGVLHGLGGQLGRLRAEGLSVHWATVERQLESEAGEVVAMPVALVLVSRLEHATTTVMVPTELRAEH